MKKVKRGLFLTGFVLSVLLLPFFASCAKKEASPGDVMSDSIAVAPAERAAKADASAVTPVPSERKLIRRADLSLRVDDLAAAEASVRALAEGAGGFLASADTGTGFARLVLRVPQGRFDSVLASIGPVGRVARRSVSSEDVTLQYHDLAEDLKTKRALAETYRSYLRSAKSIEDILAVERRISEVQSEIDRLGGDFARLADLVDYATINVELIAPDVREPGPGLGESLRSVVSGFGRFAQGLVAVVVAIVLYGTPIIGVLLLFWWILFGKVGVLRRVARLVGISPRAGGETDKGGR
jgi:hypothetical protein